MLVYGASNQFFPCAGFAGDEHRGIGWGHFDDAREHALQGWRRSHNLLEHERRIDLLPERKVFVTHPFLSSLDRKSTRLNSSHQIISYAVFCLKKKKKNNQKYHRTNYIRG